MAETDDEKSDAPTPQSKGRDEDVAEEKSTKKSNKRTLDDDNTCKSRVGDGVESALKRSKSNTPSLTGERCSNGRLEGEPSLMVEGEKEIEVKSKNRENDEENAKSDENTAHANGIVLSVEEKPTKDENISRNKLSNSSSSNMSNDGCVLPKPSVQKDTSNNAVEGTTSDPQKNPDSLESEEKESNNLNRGRWSKDEHELFLKGLSVYGKRWKLIGEMISTRSAVQIRSHAQKHFDKIERAQHGRLRKSAAAILKNQQLMNQQHMAMMNPMAHPMMYPMPYPLYMNPYMRYPVSYAMGGMGGYPGTSAAALQQATEQMSAALSAAESGGMATMPTYDYPLDSGPSSTASTSLNSSKSPLALHAAASTAPLPPQASMQHPMMPHYACVPRMEDLSGAPFYYGTATDGVHIDGRDERQTELPPYTSGNAVNDPKAPFPVSPVMGYYPTSSQRITRGNGAPPHNAIYSHVAKPATNAIGPPPAMNSMPPIPMPHHTSPMSGEGYARYPHEPQMYDTETTAKDAPRNFDA